MMKKIKIIGIIVLLAIISSCKTTSKLAPQPEWVLSRPANSAYYIGISSAPKKGLTPAEYIKNAKENALADLASNISIKIESSSALSMIENNDKLNQSFTQEINASTRAYLEGYEQVGEWENNDYYWVYYRLSKATYQQQKENRKNGKISDAKNKYLQGRAFLEQGKHVSAIKYYIDALVSIKNYLGESTNTDIDNSQKELGITLINSITDIVSNIEIENFSKEITKKKYIDYSANEFKYRILDKNKVALESFPMNVSFSGLGLTNEQENTDNDGYLYCHLTKIKSSSNSESLTVEPNMLAISRYTDDGTIRTLIKNLPAKKIKIIVNLEKPTMIINTIEKEFNANRQTNEIYNAFTTSLSSAFEIIKEGNADFTLNVDSDVAKTGTSYGETQTALSYSITITNSNGNLVYSKNNKTSGSASSAKSSSQKAYSEFSKNVGLTICRDIISRISK